MQYKRPVVFACQLGRVPNQEAGRAGEFVLALRGDLDDEFLGYDFPAGSSALHPGAPLQVVLWPKRREGPTEKTG